MSLFADGWSFLDRGGWVMYCILAVSMVAAALIALKMLQFGRSGVGRTRFVEPVLRQIRDGDVEPALAVLARERSPLARVMVAAIQTSNSGLPQSEREAEVVRVSEAEVHNLETFMRGLELIGNISPLLGLLGTVTGMIKAFQVIESAGTAVDPTTLAGGIWEALLTTAFGLIVAIPVLAAYYLLDAQIERLRVRMQDYGAELLKMAAAR